MINFCEQTEKELAKLPKLECDVCNADIDAFYNLSTEASRLNAQFLKRASWSNQSGKLFVPGRVVVLRNAVGISFNQNTFSKLISCLQHSPGNLAVILGNHPNLGPDGQRSDIKAFRILVLVTPGQKSGKEGERIALVNSYFY